MCQETRKEGTDAKSRAGKIKRKTSKTDTLLKLICLRLRELSFTKAFISCKL